MLRITSIGEILFDIYEDKKAIGGAPFNFIYHVINLTGKGNFISRIGNDELGRELLKFLEEKKVKAHIQIDKTHPTGTAKANLNESTKLPKWEISADSSFDFIEPDVETGRIIQKHTDCLYFGILAQRENHSRKTIQSLFGKGIKYFCDLNIRQNFYSKEVIEKSLAASKVVKMNIEELKLLNDLLVNDSFGLKNSAEKIKSKYNIDLLCITLGEEGAVLFKDNDINSYKSRSSIKVVDTVGAGDAYASILCIGYMLNWKLEKINEAANEFAGEIVKIKGALPEGYEIYNKFRGDIF
jgi:fructokinase